MSDSKRILANYETQDSSKQALREKLYQMQTQLREIEVSIESDRIKNQNLKNIQNAEKELREVRDKQESVLLKSAAQSQMESMDWVKREQQGVQESEKKIDQ